MRLFLLSISSVFLIIFDSQAKIHTRTTYLIDIEINKNQFLIDCSGVPEDDNVIVGFNLLDEDTYYLFYYRGVRTKKRCAELKNEYMNMLKHNATVRIVGNHPDQRVMHDYDRNLSPAPYNKAKKIVSAFFIRLQAGDKCKAYFREHCILPKNYWGGVEPAK